MKIKKYFIKNFVLLILIIFIQSFAGTKVDPPLYYFNCELIDISNYVEDLEGSAILNFNFGTIFPNSNGLNGSQALEFTSGAGELYILSNGTFDMASGDFSINMWVRVLTNYPVYQLLSKGSFPPFTNGDISLWLDASGYLFFEGSETGALTGTESFMIGSNLNMLTVTFKKVNDYYTGTVYKNGVNITGNNGYQPTGFGGSEIGFGHDVGANGGGFLSEVDIDEITIWDYALDGGMVQALYENTRFWEFDYLNLNTNALTEEKRAIAYNTFSRLDDPEPMVKILFKLDKNDDVSIKVMDRKKKVVKDFFWQKFDEGINLVEWEIKNPNMKAGIYYIIIESEDWHEIVPIALIR